MPNAREWTLNPKLAPNWFTNVKVIEITPNPGLSGIGPFILLRFEK